MSRRRKLEKFADLLTFDHVYEIKEMGSPLLRKDAFCTVDLRGKWRSDVFHNDRDICLELACGRGEYALALARKNPNVNYIGVDIKGARIWKGARIALEEGIENVVFLRTRIEELVNYFIPGEVNEAWITFPDPFPAKTNRRLTSPRFLDTYKKVLKSKGKIHLKTDDSDFFEYSVQAVNGSKHYTIIRLNRDIYKAELLPEELTFQTYYEKQHLQNNKTIKYLLFCLNA